MARNTSIRHKIAQRGNAIGTLVSLPSPSLTELLSKSGLDWLFIDMEHAPLSFSDVQAMIQAMAPSCQAYIRLPEASEYFVKQALDTGCDGIIVPMVNDAATARAVVNWAMYPPLGARSVGYGRSTLFGARLVDSLRGHNTSFSVFVQIEHKLAVERLDEIANVDGLDGLFVGPFDLSGSFGKPGEISAPEVQAAMTKVVTVANNRDLIAGIFAANDQSAMEATARGFSFLAVDADLPRIARSCAETKARLQPASHAPA